MLNARLRFLVLSLVAALGASGAVPGGDALPAAPLQETFLKLCDLACVSLKQARAADTPLYRKYYIDSYSVRALAVAYDLTGRRPYLQACQDWSDQMLADQAGMSPAGAYYMNYGRKPGETTGRWFVADSGSIAMGVLATAARTSDPALRARYVASVRAFADLVLKSFHRDGGFTDGYWPVYDGPWWCSTGIFGSLAFLLYAECGDPRYLHAGLDAVDWLNAQDLEKTPPNTMALDTQGAAFILYYFEAYSAGLAYVPKGTERYAKMEAKMAEARAWMQANLHGLGARNPVNYFHHRGSKAGALPFHLYVWSKHQADSLAMVRQADAELNHLTSILFQEKRFEEEKNEFSQLMHFTMMSLAERLSPGSIYRR